MSTLIAAAVTIPAPAQVGVYIGSAPPPVRYERRGPMPGPGYAWREGYWGNDGGRYNWVHGYWDKAPYEGAVWNHPHYDHYNRGWAMHEGHWDHEDHGHYEDRDDRGHHGDHDDHH